MAPVPVQSRRNGFMLSPPPSTTSDSSSPVPRSPPNIDAVKSHCSSLSDGESFECFGENNLPDRGGDGGGGGDSGGSSSSNSAGCGVNGSIGGSSGGGVGSTGGGGGVDLELAPHVNSTPISEDDHNSITRHTWSRTSLRRTPSSNHENLPNRRWGSMRQSGRRQLGSNALASHLYRSSSFNSSGRSSNCDTAEDMYSDVSLDDVQDLNHKLDLLQRQVTNLADTQSTVDDRTTRTKTEYAVLQARYHMLEEQLRETELRAEDRLADEQKRHRELFARVEREAHLQFENCQIRIRTMESEAVGLREELHRSRFTCDKQAVDLHTTEEKLEIARENLMRVQEELVDARTSERKFLADKQAAEELMVELGREVERLRAERGPALPTTSPESLRLEELHQELDELRQRNKNLEEANEELQAMMLTRGVEEGRNLLNGTSHSLAQELQEMSETQEADSEMLASLTQLQTAFTDKEDENQRLKHYIDTILLNIVENYPQLLEVKAVSAAGDGISIAKHNGRI